MGLRVHFRGFCEVLSFPGGQALAWAPGSDILWMLFCLLQHFKGCPVHQSHVPSKFGKGKKWKWSRRSRTTWKSRPVVRKAFTSSTCRARDQSPGCGYPLTPSQITVNSVDLSFFPLPKRTRSQLNTLPNNSRRKEEKGKKNKPWVWRDAGTHYQENEYK